MNAFNPQATLTEIRALRHTDRESARSKMDQLKCDLATMREAGAATLNLMIRKIDDTHVSRKSLVKTVDENAHLLGDDLSGIFMSGIEQYMNVRKRLKKFLKQNGDTGVLAFVHSRYNNDEDDSSEDQRGG